MPSSRAYVPTDRAVRYLAQLGKHTGRMGQAGFHGRGRLHGAPPVPRHANWTETEGIIDFGWGRCTLHATAEALTLLAEADDQRHLRQIQDGIGGRLTRIGRRDHLAVTWTPSSR